jgi:hypothetical protein
VLETLPLGENSDDFVFDNEVLAQAALFGYRIGELSCPAHYFADASSINFRRSVMYGLGVLRICLRAILHRWGIRTFSLFSWRTARSLTAALALQNPNPEAGELHAVVAVSARDFRAGSSRNMRRDASLPGKVSGRALDMGG